MYEDLYIKDEDINYFKICHGLVKNSINLVQLKNWILIDVKKLFEPSLDKCWYKNLSNPIFKNLMECFFHNLRSPRIINTSNSLQCCDKILSVLKYDFKRNVEIILLCLKVALSQKAFQFGSYLQIKVSNQSPEHYLPKEKMLRRVIWHLFFGRFELKWKTVWD